MAESQFQLALSNAHLNAEFLIAIANGARVEISTSLKTLQISICF